jgi:hypothetical protein
MQIKKNNAFNCTGSHMSNLNITGNVIRSVNAEDRFLFHYTPWNPLMCMYRVVFAST